MEKIGTWDKKTVISVLTQGRELANELKNQLHSTEDCDSLVEKILSSYENALNLLDCVALLGKKAEIAVSNILDSPNSVEGSPRSEGSHQNSKKRKTLPRWTEQVKICSGTAFEGQLDDGYNWRKYGQKDILGANHPRAYYRCTHRNTQGCLATKQVQRADEDPSIFEVIYRGKHTCMQERLKRSKQNVEKEQELKITNQASPKVENQEMDTKEEHHLAPFSFNSTPNVDTQLFPEPNNFIGTSFSSPFLSPQTSESYFSLIGESDFGEIISNLTPMSFADFSIDQVDFDSHFLNTPDYY